KESLAAQVAKRIVHSILQLHNDPAGADSEVLGKLASAWRKHEVTIRQQTAGDFVDAIPNLAEPIQLAMVLEELRTNGAQLDQKRRQDLVKHLRAALKHTGDLQALAQIARTLDWLGDLDHPRKTLQLLNCPTCVGLFRTVVLEVLERQADGLQCNGN